MKRSMRRILPLIAGTIVAAVAGLGDVAGTSQAATMAPVRVVHQSQFGQILATPKQQALYYFTPEKDGKIHCTGSCAKVWPPLLIGMGEHVPAHIAGAMGMFGTITRPDGTHQVTFSGKPLYTFTSDKKPLQVLCNGVDGWYVVRVH